MWSEERSDSEVHTKISVDSYDVDEADHDARFDDRYSGWGWRFDSSKVILNLVWITGYSYDAWSDDKWWIRSTSIITLQLIRNIL